LKSLPCFEVIEENSFLMSPKIIIFCHISKSRESLLDLMVEIVVFVGVLPLATHDFFQD
jgi:hypothetical protein